MVTWQENMSGRACLREKWQIKSKTRRRSAVPSWGELRGTFQSSGETRHGAPEPEHVDMMSEAVSILTIGEM